MRAFNKDFNQLEILSIGKGNRTFKDGNIRKNGELKQLFFPEPVNRGIGLININ